MRIRAAALYCDKLASAETTSIATANPEIDTQKIDSALFEREWIWLFNELAVTKMLMGNFHDAILYIEQALAFEADRQKNLTEHTGDRDSSLACELRIRINYLVALTERGASSSIVREIRKCKELLSRLKSASAGCLFDGKWSEHDELKLLSSALAVCEAQVKRMSLHVDQAIELLDSVKEKVAHNDSHALASWWHRVYGDCLISNQLLEEARVHVDASLTEAKASGRIDVVASARLSKNWLSLRLARSTDGSSAGMLLKLAQETRVLAYRYSQQRLMKAYCTANLLLGQIFLELGSLREARSYFNTAIKIAASCGMRVKRIDALKGLGQALKKDAEVDSAIEASGREIEYLVDLHSSRNNMDLAL